MSDLTTHYESIDTITFDEARRRIPAVERIQDPDMSHEVMQITRRAPEYFWIRPGSYSGYHNACRHGLWHHTLKLNTAIDTLAPSLIQAGVIGRRDVDKSHAAAIIHDQWKNGPDPESQKTADTHPKVVADIVRDHSELDAVVALAVEQHMGPWDKYDTPSNPVSQLVHNADLMASERDVTMAVYGPRPEELKPVAWSTMEVPDDDTSREDATALVEVEQ